MKFVPAMIGAVAGLAALLPSSATGLTVSPLFGDGAVLQRGVPQPIWGEATPGAPVSVTFAGGEYATQADESGHWIVTMPAAEAAEQGRELTVRGEGKVLTSRNVVVGDVWLCSGQSNMEWTLKNSPRFDAERARGEQPLIRHFKVGRVIAEEPASNLSGAWRVASAATLGEFTAVGYHFAAIIQPRIGVPVGLVNSSWGGASLARWMDAATLARFPYIAENWQKAIVDYPQRLADYEKRRAEWKAAAAEKKARGEPVGNDWPTPPPGPGTKQQPGGMFNGMIAPLAKFPFRGILWYQAEGDTGRAAAYAREFPAFLKGWRSIMKTDTPFLFVQLPKYNVPRDDSGLMWAELREAQRSVLSLPATGMAVTIDAGVPDNGHPPDKIVVGERLARLALVSVYHLDAGDAAGPLATGAEFAGNEATLRFSEAASGLQLVSTAGFEVRVDNAWQPAGAVVVADGGLVVSAMGDGVIDGVRYAWRNNPVVALRNGQGLPAAPFSFVRANTSASN